MGSLSHLGGSALVLTVVAITPHAFYLLLRDLFCSQTSSISQWPQGNNIRSNCCKVYPMNSIKCSSWYCLPRFLFGLFSAILPIWFIPCFSFQLLFGRRVNLVFSLFSSHLFFFLYYFSLSTYLISTFTVSPSHVSFELFSCALPFPSLSDNFFLPFFLFFLGRCVLFLPTNSFPPLFIFLLSSAPSPSPVSHLWMLFLPLTAHSLHTHWKKRYSIGTARQDRACSKLAGHSLFHVCYWKCKCTRAMTALSVLLLKDIWRTSNTFVVL